MKLDDVRRAVDLGADEIDMVIDRGAMLSGGLRELHAHAFVWMHHSHHTLGANFHARSPHRQAHPAGNRKRRRNLEVTSSEAQVGKLAADRRIVLVVIGSVSLQPLAQTQAVAAAAQGVAGGDPSR